MSCLRPFLTIAALFATRAAALFSQGSISDRDYQLTYSGYNDTTAFCTAFRAECVDYVGTLNYHHNLDCVVSQSGPTISAWCGGVEKDAEGDTGSGPALDFTHLVCPETKGCTIAEEPRAPVDIYSSAVARSSTATTAVKSASTASAAARAPSTTSKGKKGEDEITDVPDTPPTDSSLLTSMPSTATRATFASQASAAAPTLEHLFGGVSSAKTGGVNAASTSSGDALSDASSMVAVGNGKWWVGAMLAGTGLSVLLI
ncbi:hypothetical protein JCM11251_007566 [Rhodosporidiobolus azoricus]